MNSTHRILATLAALVVPLHAQTTSQKSEPAATEQIEKAFAELRRTLDRAHSHHDASARRRRALEAFLEKHAVHHEHREPVLIARCRLGTLLLTAFDHAGARRQFQNALQHASATALDVRGRALYGLGQAHELAGERETAMVYLRRAVKEVRGTRYARYADVALDRLTNATASIIGAPAPEFGPRLDIDGKPRRLAEFEGQPACVLFCSARSAKGLEEVGEWLAAIDRARLPTTQVVMFVMHAEPGSIRALATRQQWKMPIIECEREFLDPAAMAFRVRELPALLLVGPDRTAVARTPSVRRLEDALRMMREPR